jgi:Holliday junction resolvase-like predicted endonuclease
MDSSEQNFYNKSLWDQWEEIVSQHYKNAGYIFIQKKFTIQWWELDLIFFSSDKNEMIFIEVKAIDNTEDIFWYLTKKKLSTLKRTIEYYLYQNHIKNKLIRLDVVFVKNNKIIEIYENVTNN